MLEARYIDISLQMLIYDFAIYSFQVQTAKLAVHYSLSRKQ
jgi:hypothetical protein